MIARFTPRSKTAWTIAITVVLLVAGALYEFAVAVGIVPMGELPGDEPPGSAIVGTAALALLVGIVISGSCAFRRTADWSGIIPLLAPASAAFVVAEFYSFDPYFLPTLRRYSEDGAIHGRWIAALVVMSLVASGLSKLRPRIGALATSVVLLLGIATFVFVQSH